MTSTQQAGPAGKVHGVTNSHAPPPQPGSKDPADQWAGMRALMSLATTVPETESLPLDDVIAAPKRSEVGPPPPAAARSGGQHRAPGERHGARFLVFGAIGASVFVAGLAMQIALVHFLHLDVVAAYIIQGIASIQLSFLLNRYVTWRDRSVPFMRALWRFNTQKTVATVINMAAYALLVRLGVQYVVANIALTAVFTPLNYVVSHYWSFKARTERVTTAHVHHRAASGVTVDERTVRAEEPPSVARSAGRPLRWPLAAILCVQAALSLSLVWSNTAFGDEASYLVQGHLEWAHRLHGSRIPAFTGSGAPLIYPPLGALADSLAGLAGARILSICFMLGATALLYLTAQRLFGDWAAVIGAALWAASEPVLRLAFSTPEPLGCFLMALSAYVAVQAGIRRRHGELVALAAVLLALASATAFSIAVMIPAVVAFAFFAWRSVLGTRMAVWFAGWLAGGTVVLVVGLFTFLHLWLGALHSTFTRPATTSGNGLVPVVRDVWSWDGLILALAAVGVAAAFTGARNRNRRLLLLTLFTSALLVPAYQAAMGTGAWLLDERMSAGSWLLAMGAGYAVARLAPLSRWSTLTSMAAVACLLMYPLVTGTWYARSSFRGWPNTGTFVTHMRPLAGSDAGPILVTTTDHLATILEYYLLQGDNWQRWQAASNEVSGVSTGRFSFVVLELNGSFGSAALTEGVMHYPRMPLARQILQLATGSGQLALASELEHSPYYRIKLSIPYSTSNAASSTGIFVVWQHVPAKG